MRSALRLCFIRCWAWYSYWNRQKKRCRMSQKELAQWPLGKIVVLILVAAFAGLLFDLRYEHNHILAKHEIGWTPIIHSAVSVLVGAAGLALWDRGGRLLLMAIFGAGFVVGALGFWYHGQGHILVDIGQMLSVWAGAHPNPRAQAAAAGPAGLCRYRIVRPSRLLPVVYAADQGSRYAPGDHASQNVRCSRSEIKDTGPRSWLKPGLLIY